MNTNKLPDAMDITQYLQTEGRRIAAELSRRRPLDYTPAAPQQQQQGAVPGAHNPPRSLSETLQRMGIAPAPTHRV
ncbi:MULTISPECIES: hypothetical protein [unclassified Polaromonas]|jgi:hypothetical protein|uniref:hypothetical protein n=1 Tax=unclassified Polaromonas TaxID=2638319 RepID=UPI000F08BF62|nr:MULTISPECIES: hypothetical protein [unclassified Polaromonas]AYQ29711.1 hypothetical protein DT070_17845 [Polaromonas sp. SP1]QGJ19174.1 hypothetical protein F7R28_12740 [Polaromonas sp. Pch-P]